MSEDRTFERDDLRDEVASRGWCPCHAEEDAADLRAAVLAVLNLTDGWEQWYLAETEKTEGEQATCTGTVLARVEEIRSALCAALDPDLDPVQLGTRWV